MRGGLTDRLVARPLRNEGGAASRRATARLCRGVRRPRPPAARLAAGVRLLVRARDERLTRPLRAALEAACADPAVLTFVLGRLAQAVEGPWHDDRDGALTPELLAFLAGPAPGGGLRLTAYAGARGRGLLAWFVAAVCGADDEEVREAGVRLLGGCGHPALLRLLEGEFVRHADAELRGASPYGSTGPLWDAEGRPSPLTRACLANPGLPLEPVDGGGFSVHSTRSGVLLAVLKGRLDLVPDYVRARGASGTVGALLGGTRLAAPVAFTGGCRVALRALPAGAGREELCRVAATGRDPAALAAVREAGVCWGGSRAAFLYLTEQWAGYDAADPDGGLMRAFCAGEARGGSGAYRARVRELARLTGRADPWPAPVPPVPPQRRRHPAPQAAEPPRAGAA
ncbi:hypothetical protein [Streptomyces sp. NPDC049881]|uniref:hypothetical protein n=1 Tax=Streptomyces sp. NPDC049881 TaxID=3155778 RepID=UPI00343D03EB